MVHLIHDQVDPVDVYLNDQTEPLIGGDSPLPQYGNTDAYDVSYVPFPPFSYDIHVVNSGDPPAPSGGTDLLLMEDEAIETGMHYTVLLWGMQSAGTTAGWVIDDTRNSAADVGTATIFHTGTPEATYGMSIPLDVYVEGNLVADDLVVGAASPEFTQTAGTQTWGFDWDQDTVADAEFDVTIGSEEWAYVYILPDPYGYGIVGALLFHKDGDVNTAIYANTP